MASVVELDGITERFGGGGRSGEYGEVWGSGLVKGCMGGGEGSRATVVVVVGGR